MILNIPTDMLRTLVAVVDHKSFTKAAMSLGVTQPAVSAQIKRLQIVLGVDIFAKDVAGIVLTPSGDAVVTYARRMLSINDQIVKIVSREPAEDVIRIGLTGDFFSGSITEALAKFRKQWPNRNFKLFVAHGPDLLQRLRAGELDIAVTFTPTKPERDARLHWTEEMIWARGRTLAEPLPEVVPLVARDDHWMNYGLAVAALDKVGRSYEFTLTAPTILALLSAVNNGLGLLPFARRRIGATNLVICQDKSLPKLPEIVCSLCVREAADSKMLDDLAHLIADVVKPGSESVELEKLPEFGQQRR
ncbi:MAG: LysR family transcriptional regulator [Xanthobacteraceae bacterium]